MIITSILRMLTKVSTYNFQIDINGISRRLEICKIMCMYCILCKEVNPVKLNFSMIYDKCFDCTQIYYPNVLTTPHENIIFILFKEGRRTQICVYDEGKPF